MKKRTDYKKQSIGILMVAAVVSVLLAGTILGPMQTYASSNNNNPGSLGSTDDGFIGSPSLKQGIHDEIRADLKNTNQSINQDNVCFKSNTCRQSEVGQNTLGNDNQVTGFADQSTTNTTTTNAATSGPAGPAGAQGDPGAVGAKGDKGDPGAQGAVGPAGPPRTLVVIQRSSGFVEILPSPSPIVLVSAKCNPGELATGGGYRTNFGSGNPPVIIDSVANAGNTGWDVFAFNSGSTTNAIGAFAQCTSLAP
jgi:hypothetical protein